MITPTTIRSALQREGWTRILQINLVDLWEAPSQDLWVSIIRDRKIVWATQTHTYEGTLRGLDFATFRKYLIRGQRQAALPQERDGS